MILAATDWLTISINLLLVIFVIICILMTLMILMQRPKQEGLGAAFGGGMTDQMFGARTTNVLQRGTVWFASLFFVLALTLAVLIGMKNSRTESLVVAEEPEEAETTTPPSAEPAEDVVQTIRDLVEDRETPEDAPVGDPLPLEEAPVDDAPTDETAVEENPDGTSGSEENSGQR